MFFFIPLPTEFNTVLLTIIMKKSDLIFIICCAVVLLPFFLFSSVYEGFLWTTKNYPFVMSFVKFGILATAGECIGLRIRTGKYNAPGFGVMPRAITWGFLGMMISAAMTIFSGGAPNVLMTIGITPPEGITYAELLKSSIFSSLSWYHFLAAFTVSVTMNCFFAPVFMMIHKVSDTHITNNGGTMRGYFSPLYVRKIFVNLDWDSIWNFLFKKTIPLFWVPAHTITFMLPPEWRVLFAALLGVMLGVFMSLATKK